MRRATSSAAAIFEAWFLQLAPTIAGDDLGPLATLASYAGRFSFVTRFLVNTLDRERLALVRRSCTTATAETCDEAVTAALHDGGRRSDAPARRRHDALALGRRPSRDFPAPGTRRGRAAAPAPQPLGAERRRLEHGQRRRRVGRPAVRAALGRRLPRDHRSLARQRQPLHRSTSASQATSCRRTTTIFCRTGRRCSIGRCAWRERTSNAARSGISARPDSVDYLATSGRQLWATFGCAGRPPSEPVQVENLPTPRKLCCSRRLAADRVVRSA